MMTTTHSHIVATPRYFLIIRILQVVLAIVVLGLLAYLVNSYDSANIDGSNFIIGGFGLGLFTSILTFILVAYFLVTPKFLPALYNYWAVIGLEALAVIFWLVTWALLAKTVSWVHNYDNYTYYGPADDDCYYYDDCVKKRALHSFAKRDSDNAFFDIIDTALALSLIEWFLFVVTFVLFLVSALKHRKSNASPAGTHMEAQPMPSTAAPLQSQPAMQQHQPVYQQDDVYQVQQPMH